MKAFTDINQSKKLAEILPIDSADMYYSYVLPKSDRIKHNPEIGNPVNALNWYNKGYTTFGKEPITLDEYCVPCWSLAALLDFLAQQDCFPEITYTGTCYLMDINFYDDEDGKMIHPIHLIRTEGNTLIDACVEMVFKLHKQKQL